MYYLARKILNRILNLDHFSDRIKNLEKKVESLEALADENDSLWQYIEDQREMQNVFVGSEEEFQEEFTDMMVRNMKPRGDA